MTANPMLKLAEIMGPINVPFESEEDRKAAVTVARDTLADIVAATPDFFHARYYLGITESILGNNTAAIEHFNTVLPFAPSMTFAGEICYNIGAALKAQGDHKAERYFALARDLTDDPTIAELAGQALN